MVCSATAIALERGPFVYPNVLLGGSLQVNFVQPYTVLADHLYGRDVLQDPAGDGLIPHQHRIAALCIGDDGVLVQPAPHLDFITPVAQILLAGF